MTPDFPYTSENETKCTILYQKFRNFIWQDFLLFKNFEENLYIFHTSYFPYDEINGKQSSKSNGKDNKFEYNFLIIKINEDNFKIWKYKTKEPMKI
jgi:hypothetical protein